MLHVPAVLTELNIVSILVRLLMALLFGGIIGLERGVNRHPAGFRTHILVCVGAALAMMTNQYIADIWTGSSDPARIGAQVITGVGFLGAGTILVTRRNRIRGLTTAAGIWASACLGLAIGIGFYEGAIIAAVIIFISLALLPKLETYIYEHSGVMNLYVETEGPESVRQFIREVKKKGIQVQELNLDQKEALFKDGAAFTVSLRLPAREKHEETIDALSEIEGVVLIDEM